MINMQVKELLEIMDIEQKRLEEQIKQDKRNIENRNSISTKNFYTYQIYSNDKQCDALKDAIQTILRYVSVEDQPN